MNYKYLKKKINDIVDARAKVNVPIQDKNVQDPGVIATHPGEGEFFRALKTELKKASEFFDSSQQLVRIRHERVVNGYKKLLEDGKKYDKNTWSRLLRACVKFYKDVLLLENFAIMNYCGFSKILKKHDKQTGFRTREAFMRNVMSVQNFTNYPYIQEMLRESEKMFEEMQMMDRYVHLLDYYVLFLYIAGVCLYNNNNTYTLLL